MPLTLDLHSLTFVHAEEPDSDGLDEFLEDECGVRRDGTCARSGSDFCQRECIGMEERVVTALCETFKRVTGKEPSDQMRDDLYDASGLTAD